MTEIDREMMDIDRDISGIASMFLNRRRSIGRGLAATGWACLISNLLLPSTAFAYVDPGSGSVIVTTILGLIAAIGYTFRKYFYKLRRIFGGRAKNSESNDGE